ARGKAAMPDEIPIGQTLAGSEVGGTVLDSKSRVPFLAKAGQRFCIFRFACLAYRPPRVIEGYTYGVSLSRLKHDHIGHLRQNARGLLRCPTPGIFAKGAV